MSAGKQAARQHSYFCTSKASKVGTAAASASPPRSCVRWVMRAAESGVSICTFVLVKQVIRVLPPPVLPLAPSCPLGDAGSRQLRATSLALLVQKYSLITSASSSAIGWRQFASFTGTHVLAYYWCFLQRERWYTRTRLLLHTYSLITHVLAYYFTGTHVLAYYWRER